ncbi:MAG: glycosyltransferase family 2 protein [Chloroflexi bacterium]|nr:glycosyltransferase family 2 protein [Chloroflexota bacterium]
MEGVDLSVIIVSWNVRDLLRACLQAVVGEPLSQEVIVVDNASTDGTPGMVRDKFPQVQLIASAQNLGFTGGNNLGIRRSRGRYVLILNPDTRPQPGAIPAMLTFMEAHPEAGAVGPELLWADGSVQSSRRRFPTLATGFLESTIVQRYWRDNRVLRRYYCQDMAPREVQAVDWVVGACIMMRRAALDEVGLLDEGYFMYSEELDWCYRAKQAGWQVYHLPQARVMHYHGKSSEQNLLARELRFQDSKLRFYAKHRGRWQAQLLRLFLLSTNALEAGGLSAKMLLSRRNYEGRRARRNLVAAAFRWQLARLLGRDPGVAG